MDPEPARVEGESNGFQLAGVDSAELARELAGLRAHTDSPLDYRRALLQLLARMTRAVAAAYVEAKPEGGYTVGPTLLGAPARAALGDTNAIFAATAAQASARQGACQRRLPDHPGMTAIAAPAPADGTRVLVVISSARDYALLSHVLLTQLCAALIDGSTTGESSVSKTGITRCAEQIMLGTDGRDAFARLSDALAADLGGGLLFTALRERDHPQLHLHATSRAGHFDTRSNLARDMAQLIEDGTTTGDESLAACRERVLHALNARSLTVAWLDHPGRMVAGVGALLAGTDGASDLDDERLAARLAPWAPLLDLRAHAYPGLADRLKQRLQGTPRRIALAAALAMLLVLGAWPVTDRVTAEVLIEPATQRIVSAPFAGLLESIAVRAGDNVTAGQVVVRMDEQELRLERESLTAEQQQLEQRESAHRARGELEATQQARLELEKLALRAALIERRLQQLAVAAPIDGVVLTAGLEREVGRAVSTGQPLLEIAPLAQVRAEFRVPATEIARIGEHADVRFELDAFADREYMTQVERVRPRAELGDGESYFVAEATLDNTEQLLRPGMRGRADLMGRRVALAWRFARAPVDALRRWRGW